MGHVVGRRGFVIAGALLASAGILWWSATRERERSASVERPREESAEISRTAPSAVAAAAGATGARESLAPDVVPGQTPPHRITGRVLEPRAVAEGSR